ncbi:MAG TPA: phosphoribosylformylglycinamidine synthase subunit PurL [Candidatus Xenobia bacterium]|jgi:phosphoribosylformylglycinamidine synthase
MSVAERAYAALGLSDEEYRRILDILGREPTPTELAMFSVEWSEHCGYPRSRVFLSKLPREGRFKPLVGTDAGGIEVNGHIVLFKMESHNHPSQVEPKAGAATGVGGIIRDIVSMGARPVALLDALKFGDARDPSTAFYVKGVVDGIAAYGNCIGIPTVGGEVLFDRAYAGNCLVNVMCVGVVASGGLMTSQARPGGSVMYVGPRTGRDGIGGCSVLASKEFGADDSKRPNVQIGDPFSGKCLMEATLEAIASGALISLKDMGAAGLTCTTAEMADAGGCGMEVDLAQVPRRETGMAPYEVMMSESQERMLAVVQAGREAEVAAIYTRWGLPAAVLGRTIEGNELVIRDGAEVVARLPVRELTHPQPIQLPQVPATVKHGAPRIVPSGDWARDLKAMVGSPNLSSRRWIFRQYDHMVGTSTVLRPGAGDAAVIRVEDWALAAVMDSCPRYAALDPYEGARHAVAEACRNLSCVGAEPAGITDGLNFGNPDKPDRFWQLVRTIEGIADACRALGLPVVSGNVSLYNESPAGAILPTAIVGAVGVLGDVKRTVGAGFRQEGDRIVLLEGAKPRDFAGSAYALEVHGAGLSGAPPPLDLAVEAQVQKVVREAIIARRVHSAHDVSDGGLAVALAECCLLGGLGAEVTIGGTDRALAWFGEAPSRIVVTCSAEVDWTGVPARGLGKVGGTSLVLDGVRVDLKELRAAYESLPEVLGL